MSASRKAGGVITALAIAACVLGYAAAPSAQRGGGMRGGGGGGAMMSSNREDVLIAMLFLTGDQKKGFKNIMDAQYKSTAPLRDELARTRAALSAFIDQEAAPETVDQAVASYASPVAEMNAAEMRALAQILALLTPEQEPSASTVQTAASLMRGAFVGKKWNTGVDSHFY